MSTSVKIYLHMIYQYRWWLSERTKVYARHFSLTVLQKVFGAWSVGAHRQHSTTYSPWPLVHVKLCCTIHGRCPRAWPEHGVQSSWLFLLGGPFTRNYVSYSSSHSKHFPRQYKPRLSSYRNTPWILGSNRQSMIRW